jgi:hypothetical protein
METFLIVLMIIGTVPFCMLVFFLVDLYLQSVYTVPVQKKKSRMSMDVDNSGFEQISMPKKGK